MPLRVNMAVVAVRTLSWSGEFCISTSTQRGSRSSASHGTN
jgi:hypothetical protein